MSLSIPLPISQKPYRLEVCGYTNKAHLRGLKPKAHAGGLQRAVRCGEQHVAKSSAVPREVAAWGKPPSRKLRRVPPLEATALGSPVEVTALGSPQPHFVGTPKPTQVGFVCIAEAARCGESRESRRVSRALGTGEPGGGNPRCSACRPLF